MLCEGQQKIRLRCESAAHETAAMAPQIERGEIHVRSQILRAGCTVELLARAMVIVCEESSPHVALVVQLLRFVAVVNAQKKSAMQPTRRFFDPIARSEIHFGHLLFAQGYSLRVEIF